MDFFLTIFHLFKYFIFLKEEPCEKEGGMCRYSYDCTGTTLSGKCPTQASKVKCCIGTYQVQITTPFSSIDDRQMAQTQPGQTQASWALLFCLSVSVPPSGKE